MPQLLPFESCTTFSPNFFYLVCIVFACAAWLAVQLRKLSVSGGIVGFGVASILFLGTGFYGVSLMGLFFILGTLASMWKYDTKLRLGVAEAQKGQRSHHNVLTNAGIPTLCAAAIFLGLPCTWAYWLIAGAFCAATADTLASELGTLYGKNYWDIRKLQPRSVGEDGAISIEGTVLSTLGSILPAAWATYYLEASFVLCVGFVVAGLLGNLFDSWLGSKLQQNGHLNNHQVNVGATLMGACCAWLWAWILY